MRPRDTRWQGPVFLVNSRLGLVTAAPSGSGSESLHPTRGAPPPEVTGPSCRVPWRGVSRPPRSARPAHLCRSAVRAPTCSLAAFLGGPGSARSARAAALASRSPLGRRPGGFACRGSLPAWRAASRPPGLPPRVPASLVAHAGGAGIWTGCPSPAPRGLGLGPPHPQRISLAAEPSGIRWGRFARPSRYSCRHSRSHPLHLGSRLGFPAGWDAPLP
jgi:hypothetical protein